MSFISYAQNHEDVLLWRALGHVTPAEGFYIDVGANDPVEHSVTKAFYDAGWRGISIEPLPSFHAAFLEQRPRDVNLAIAAGSGDGELTLYDVPSVRGWASPEQSVADAHRAEGYEVAELKVPVRTLASVCEEYVDGPIHFLKIDVEGFEGEVLRGMDFARWRPWILVVEATLPGSLESAHETWEHLVTGQRYRYAWFDGLNRYYVAEEQQQLLAHFGIQPNVFDDYISHHLDKAWEANRAARDAMDAAREETERALRSAQENVDRIAAELHDALAKADADVARLTAELARANANGAQATQWARELEQRLVATLNSTSWKVTRPLRYAGAIVAKLRTQGLAGRVVKRVVTRLTANERVRRTLIPILVRNPALGRRVSATLQAIKQTPPAQPPLPAELAVPEELRALPASVRGVLADLQRARKRMGQ